MLPGVGVFGTSLTARVIIPLLKDEGFSVKALWGRTQEEAEELAKEMSVPFYTSRIDEVLLHQDVDLVCINLPPPLTRQIAVKTLGEPHPDSSYSSPGCASVWGTRGEFHSLIPPPPVILYCSFGRLLPLKLSLCISY
uniref:Gfo/Idh/MocA-like oxidoreductase N-terminal domain-containing protein n=1 Tax=Sphenodon punctatus TaxID=8508 RepID=A0A8D0G2F6_SPHPU